MSAYRVESTPGASKKLRKKAGGAQMSFAVNRQSASAFSAALLSGDPLCERAAPAVFAHRQGPVSRAGERLAAAGFRGGHER